MSAEPGAQADGPPVAETPVEPPAPRAARPPAEPSPAPSGQPATSEPSPSPEPPPPEPSFAEPGPTEPPIVEPPAVEPGPTEPPAAELLSSEPAAPARPARRAPRLRAWQAAAATLVVAGVVTASVLVAGGGGGSDGDDAKPAASSAVADGLPHTAVDVSTGTCGKGWTRPRPGTQVFDLHNSGLAATEVYLSDPKSGKFYAELEGLAPGETRPVTVDLGSGTYVFKCLAEDTDAVTGPAVTVPGKAPQGPATLPVTQHDLIPPTLAYQKWIGARIADLAAGAAALKADIDRGNLTAARRDWLSAHLVYERMGAAYGTFGDTDGAVNGTTALGGDPADDPSFTGFHRIEYGLWHGSPTASLRGPAAKLVADVAALRASWPQARMDPADMGLRAHEIVENTVQFELTGRTDYGSGTSLAAADANLDGTREVLTLLRPLLTPRDPGLAELDATLQRTQAYLGALRHDGTWTPLADLTRAQREQVNAGFGDLVEQLAPVAAIFDVRRTA